MALALQLSSWGRVLFHCPVPVLRALPSQFSTNVTACSIHLWAPQNACMHCICFVGIHLGVMHLIQCWQDIQKVPGFSMLGTTAVLNLTDMTSCGRCMHVTGNPRWQHFISALMLSGQLEFWSQSTEHWDEFEEFQTCLDGVPLSHCKANTWWDLHEVTWFSSWFEILAFAKVLVSKYYCQTRMSLPSAFQSRQTSKWNKNKCLIW